MMNLLYKIRFLWYAYFTKRFSTDHALAPATRDVLLDETFENNKFTYDWHLPSWDEQPWTDWTGQTVIYLPSQYKIENGVLIMTTDNCVPQKPGYPDKMSWEITSTTFLNRIYGFAEICMIPSQVGWSCPWWYQSDNRPKDVYGYEIDFGEFECDTPDAFTITVWHYDKETGKKGTILKSARFQAANDLTKNYHTFGCDWQATYVDFYFDGLKIYRYTGEIPNSSCYFINGMAYKTGTLPVSSYTKQVRVQV